MGLMTLAPLVVKLFKKQYTIEWKYENSQRPWFKISNEYWTLNGAYKQAKHLHRYIFVEHTTVLVLKSGKPIIELGHTYEFRGEDVCQR